MTTPAKPGRPPWEKEFLELTKYDWLTAVGLHKAHKNRPLDLRVAYAIMQHAHVDTKVAWPSQRTLARFTGAADERQVRTAITSLVTSGALSRRTIGKLDAETRATVDRKARGRIYRLEMFWAWEVLEGAQKTRREEPETLRLGRERKRTAAVLCDRTNAVRCEQDDGRPPNTKLKLTETAKGALEGVQDLASPRATNRYALAKARAD